MRLRVSVAILLRAFVSSWLIAVGDAHRLTLVSPPCRTSFARRQSTCGLAAEISTDRDRLRGIDLRNARTPSHTERSPRRPDLRHRLGDRAPEIHGFARCR